MISYVDKMREFRGGGQQAAMLETPKRIANPLKVDRSYRKWRSLSADLTRYYESCILSKTAKRFQGARRKMYCAGVAWRRAKESGRYSDYPGFTKRNSTMAGKSRKKSRAAKRRKRDRFGRFLEPVARRVKKKTSSRENPISKAAAKRRGKKAAATRKRNANKKKRTRTAGKKPVKKKKTVKRAKKKTVAREETPMRRKRRRSVVRRSRRRARSAAHEEIAENPISKRAAKARGRKAAATRKRNKNKRRKASRKGAQRAARTRRGATTAVVRSVVKKGSRKRSVPGTIKIVLSTPKRAPSSKRRRSVSKKKRKSSKRKTRKLGPRLTPASHQLTAGEGFFENPLGSALENPLSGGEMALAFVTGGVGYVVSDLLDRYLATSKDASASANSVQILSAPSVTRMAAQAGLTAVPMALAYWVRNPMARSALQGLGLGAGFHLVGQILKTYVLAKVLKDNPMGQQLLPDTISANSTAALSVPPTAGTAGVGRKNRINSLSGVPYGQLGAFDVGPRALVGVGIDVVPGGDDAPVQGQTQNVPVFPQPVPVYPSAPTPVVPAGSNGGCMPCSAETAHAAVVDAYRAARDEVGSGASGCGYLSGPPSKIKPSASFPD